jgi:hypothetical protein
LLGAVGIFFHDFALQWQPVRADLPARVPLACVAGALLTTVVRGEGIVASRPLDYLERFLAS